MATQQRRIGMAAIVVLLGLVALLLVLWVFQRRLIYFPDATSPSASSLPSGWSEVEYQTTDGLRHGAWLKEPESGQPVVIVFSGNAGNRGDRLDLGTELAAAGFGVLLTDYRGYGGNPGHPTEDGLARDANAAVRFIKDAFPEHAFAFFGESLGAGVAVGLAVTDPPEALVLRSPFTSLEDVARAHYAWLPVSALLKDRYPSLDRIATIDVPVMVIAGDADRTVPFTQSKRLFDAASEPKRFLTIEGADHNDAILVSSTGVIKAVEAFIEDVIGS